MILADVLVPTTWAWPAIFGVVVAFIAYLAKAKADRWDAAADRTHELSNHIAALQARIDDHARRLDALEKE